MKNMFITKNRSGEKLVPVGVVLHCVGVEGSTAINNRNYFNNNQVNASAHIFLDWNDCIQTVPFDEVAWHAGYTANHRFIGIELCEPTGYDLPKFEKVWTDAVRVFADLFVDLLHIDKITAQNLMSHAEVSAKWRETDHTDPVAYFKKYGRTADMFRADVQNEMDRRLKGDIEMEEVKALQQQVKDLTEIVEKMADLLLPKYGYIDDFMPDWARPTIQKLMNKGYLKGDETGNLQLSYGDLRHYAINDRAGMYGE